MPTAAMACEEMCCPGQSSLPPQRLSRLYHPLPQEPDVCPSIALALEQLQAVDMALDGPVGVPAVLDTVAQFPKGAKRDEGMVRSRVVPMLSAFYTWREPPR